MVGLDKSAVGCVPGRHSVGRRLEAFDDEAPQPISVRSRSPIRRPASANGLWGRVIWRRRRMMA
jgi:hypothetical protein